MGNICYEHFDKSQYNNKLWSIRIAVRYVLLQLGININRSQLFF